MWIAAVLILGMFLLYWYGYLSISTKMAVTFLGTGGWGSNCVGASFTSCTGNIYHILRFHESRSYSFHLSGHIQQGSVSVEIRDGQKQSVLLLNAATPSGILSAEKGQRYYVHIRIDHASGDYQLDWT